MATIITPTLLNEYFVNKKRHKGYKLSEELYEQLEVHAEGEFPEDLIGNMRPSESNEVFVDAIFHNHYRTFFAEIALQQKFANLLGLPTAFYIYLEYMQVLRFPNLETQALSATYSF